MLKTLPIHTSVAMIARCEEHIQHCEVAHDFYVLNSTRGENDALSLLVVELGMRSPYGPIELEMLVKLGFKRSERR